MANGAKRSTSRKRVGATKPVKGKAKARSAKRKGSRKISKKRSVKRRSPIPIVVVAIVVTALVAVFGLKVCDKGTPQNEPANSTASEYIKTGESAQPTTLENNALKEEVDSATSEKVETRLGENDSSSTTLQLDNGSYEAMKNELSAKLSEMAKPGGTNVRDATTAAGAPTAQEAYSKFEERGFVNLPVVANFDISGSYLDAMILSPSDDKKYPSCKVGYESKTGVSWYVYLNDGGLFAFPIIANDAVLEKEVIATETGSLTTYNGMYNVYSDYSADDLNTNDAAVIQVDRIDTAALDAYTPTELGDM